MSFGGLTGAGWTSVALSIELDNGRKESTNSVRAWFEDYADKNPGVIFADLEIFLLLEAPEPLTLSNKSQPEKFKQKFTALTPWSWQQEFRWLEDNSECIICFNLAFTYD